MTAQQAGDGELFVTCRDPSDKQPKAVHFEGEPRKLYVKLIQEAYDSMWAHQSSGAPAKPIGWVDQPPGPCESRTGQRHSLNVLSRVTLVMPSYKSTTNACVFVAPVSDVALQ